MLKFKLIPFLLFFANGHCLVTFKYLQDNNDRRIILAGDVFRSETSQPTKDIIDNFLKVHAISKENKVTCFLETKKSFIDFLNLEINKSALEDGAYYSFYSLSKFSENTKDYNLKVKFCDARTRISGPLLNFLPKVSALLNEADIKKGSQINFNIIRNTTKITVQDYLEYWSVMKQKFHQWLSCSKLDKAEHALFEEIKSEFEENMVQVLAYLICIDPHESLEVSFVKSITNNLFNTKLTELVENFEKSKIYFEKIRTAFENVDRIFCSANLLYEIIISKTENLIFCIQSQNNVDTLCKLLTQLNYKLISKASCYHCSNGNHTADFTKRYYFEVGMIVAGFLLDKKNNTDAGYICFHCNKKEFGQKFKQCSNCKVAVYCSPECQKADWKKHKVICKV